MRLPTPEPGVDAAVAWVGDYLRDLCCDEVEASSLRGGQTEADRRLASLDISGYAQRRNEVLPVAKRGATQLSPWLRHGMLTLRQVWDAVEGASARDREKYRDELLWQEFARHWYAHLGTRIRSGVRHELNGLVGADWLSGLRCIDFVLDELHRDGWLVNQSRMWLASHWALRSGHDWRDGEDYLFRHLLDGSRAANRLGWQWTTGVGSSKPYGFSRWQVEKRAPELCTSCPLAERCPIEDWPPPVDAVPVVPPDLSRSRPRYAGPSVAVVTASPEAVWLTAESLGDDDPALCSQPDLPALFVFDEPLLGQLRLSSKRLVFLTECLGDLATRRPVEVYRGDPVEVLSTRSVAVTHAPVPGFARRAATLSPAEVHPWPWLSQPCEGSIQSFSAWRRYLSEPIGVGPQT